MTGGGAGDQEAARALLARSGAIAAAGSVEQGNTACDYLPSEKSLHHSLKLAVASFAAGDTRIHLLDTPGYPDFLGHALPALAAGIATLQRHRFIQHFPVFAPVTILFDLLILAWFSLHLGKIATWITCGSVVARLSTAPVSG